MNLVRSRLAELVDRAPALRDFKDPAVPAWAGRVRAAPVSGDRRPRDEEIAMAVFVRAADGGPLRSFSGGLAHECGLNHLVKARSTLGWEGEAAHDFLILMENEPTVRSISSENVRIEGILDGEPFRYTIDAEVVLHDGSVVFVEVKRGPDDLRDPRTRRVLAYCTEVCRRVGIPLIVVFRDAIWTSHHHRRNCTLFAGSARTVVEDRHRATLGIAADDDRHTYASLAELLEPGHPAAGRAVLRALAIRGLVLVDLTRRLRDGTKVAVRRQHGPSRRGRAARAPEPSRPPAADPTHEEEMRMSFPNRFPKNSVVRIKGADHVFNGRQAGRLNLTHSITGLPYTEVDENGVRQLIDDAAFSRLLDAGDAEVRTFGDQRSKLLASAGQVTAQQAIAIDPAAEGHMRQVVMLDDADVPCSVDAIRKFMDEHWTAELIERHGPAAPPGTLKHWLQNCGAKGMRHPRDFVRMWGRGRRGPYADDFVTEILGRSIREAKDRGEGHDAGYDSFCAVLIVVNEGRHPDHEAPETPYRIPHASTYKRWWDGVLDEESEKGTLGEEGINQVFHGAGRTLGADFAMHRVVIDHTRLRIMAVKVLDDGEIVAVGRPWLTLAIDVRTRCIVAYLVSFIPPCSWTLGEIMRRMVLPKRPPAEEARKFAILVDVRGVPVEVVVDNAPEFRTYSAERAFRASGIGVRWCRIKSPRYRAVGERPMKVLKKFICMYVPGHTMPPAEARRIGYDPAKHAVAEIDQIEGLANMAVCLYNLRRHRGILKRSPAQLFERDANAHGVRVMADLESFLRDFHVWEPQRQLTRSGIEIWALRYGGDVEVTGLLNDLAGSEPVGKRRRTGDVTATVSFCYDPMNIASIWVWNPKRRTYVELRCMTAEYSDGMPLFVHDQIRDAAKASGKAFIAESDLIEIRNRLLQAKRTLDPSQSLPEREDAMRTMEPTRQRQVAGNVVWSQTSTAQPVSAYDLVPNDRAALTAFDVEIVTSRPASPKREKRFSKRDRRDGGTPVPAEPERQAPVRRRRASGGAR